TYAPTQIDVVHAEPFVVEADPLPHGSVDQHRATVDGEHVEDPVELPLIDLAGLQRRDGVPEPVDGPADIAKLARVIEIHDLGADDPGRLGLHGGRLNEIGHGVLVKDGVAVQQQDVVGRGDDGLLQRRGEGAGVSQPVIVADHPRRAEGSLEELVRLVVGRVVDREDAERLVRLAREGVQAGSKRRVCRPNDQDREHRWRTGRRARLRDGRAGCGHGEARRSRGGEPSTRPFLESGRGARTGPPSTREARISASSRRAAWPMSTSWPSSSSPRSCASRACAWPWTSWPHSGAWPSWSCAWPRPSGRRPCAWPSLSCAWPRPSWPRSCAWPSLSCAWPRPSWPRSCASPACASQRSTSWPRSCASRACAWRSTASWRSTFSSLPCCPLPFPLPSLW